MCDVDKNPFQQETEQDQVNTQDAQQETVQAADQEQKVDQNSNQNQHLEQLFKDKNVGISTLNLVINNGVAKEKEHQWEGVITGQIINPINNAPLVGHQVDIYFASTTGYPVASTYTNGNGVYRVDSLLPGFYTLRTYSQDSQFAPVDVVNIKLVPGEVVKKNILAELNISLPKSRK